MFATLSIIFWTIYYKILLKNVKTNCRYSFGYLLCSSCCIYVFFFIMREISCIFFLTIMKQMLLKHLTLPQDILLNIDNTYLAQKIYPNELQLNKANLSDTEAPFWS